MEPEGLNIAQKQVLVKAYSSLPVLESAIAIIKRNDARDAQLSVVGKIGGSYVGDEKNGALKAHWQTLLGSKTAVGFLVNPGIGRMYIAGPFVAMFLQDIDGKKLGALSGGPYGILRGLGIDAEKVATALKVLENGGYLLMIRGKEADLRHFEDQLIPIEKCSSPY